MTGVSNTSKVILGLNHGGHDTAAALMVDGVVVAACEQERLNHEKHTKAFPLEAVEECLNIAGLALKDVDRLVYAFDSRHFIRETYLRSALESNDRFEFLMNDISYIDGVYKSQGKAFNKSGMPVRLFVTNTTFVTSLVVIIPADTRMRCL